MKECLQFCIADITFALFAEDLDLSIELQGEIKKFLVAESNPEVRVLWTIGDLPVGGKGKELFDSNALWRLYGEDGTYLFCFGSSSQGGLQYKVSRFNHDFTRGEVFLNRCCFSPRQAVYPLEYPLDELMINNFLARGRGAEIHACGIVDSDGNGLLFVGQSSAGKTTIARLWMNELAVEVLSDDRIILRRIGNKIWMYGTPWHGEAMLASPNRAPLAAIYFLEKGSKNELVPQKASDSISRLFSCSFPPFYDRDALEFTLSFLEDVVRSVPCFELRFTPDKRVVELIRGLRFAIS